MLHRTLTPNYVHLPGLIGLALILAVMSACGGSDSGSKDNAGPTPPQRTVLLSEVNGILGYVEITNYSTTETLDLSAWQICAGPPYYQPIHSMIVKDGSADYTALAPGESITVTPTLAQIGERMHSAEGSLGLYRNGEGFARPENMADFVQWGSAGHPREDIAAGAGYWTPGEFVSGSPASAYTQSLTRVSASTGPAGWGMVERSFAGTENPSPIIIAEIDPVAWSIKISNRSPSETLDMSGLVVYAGGGVFEGVSTMTLLPGSASDSAAVAPGGNLIAVPNNSTLYALLRASAAGLAVYASEANFADTSLLMDFVQWGAANQGAQSTAVAAAIWVDGAFVSGYPDTNGSPLIRRNGGTGLGAWQVGSAGAAVPYALSVLVP